MGLLFAPTVETTDVPDIPGLRYIPNYISEIDETALTTFIDQLPWDTSWQRRRQHYGTSYGKSESALPIPEWGLQLADRMFHDGVTQTPFDHMLVNEYEPGQGISLHQDYQPFDRTVVSLSLLSPCVMDFRNPTTGEKTQLLLEPRSLLVLSDEARYDWQHGIAARKTDVWHGIKLTRTRRLSITFRSRLKAVK
jgi:alkylated DNA repair dioxygenase AlkB